MTDPRENANYAALKRAYDANPEGAAENKALGLYLVGLRNGSVLAEPLLRRALEMAPRDPDAESMRFALANLSIAGGRFDEAETHLQALHRDQPRNLTYLAWLGDAVFRQGCLDEASAHYRRVVRLGDALAAARTPEGETPVRPLFPNLPVCRAFGEMASKLDLFLKARELGLLAPSRAVLVAPENEVANPALLSCLTPWIDVVSEPAAMADVDARFGDNLLILDIVPFPDGRTLPRDLAYAQIQRQWEGEGRQPLLTLPDDIAQKGRAWLAGKGMPPDARFCVLHVREPAFYGEGVPWSHNVHRNVRLDNYLDAIAAVTERGYWVVRMGRGDVTPLPPMDRVIDVASAPGEQADWLDVFLCARAWFFLGPDSGPLWVATAFGVPVAGSDWFPFGVWPVGGRDLFAPKRLLRGDGTPLTIAEHCRPDFFGVAFADVYARHGLTVADNTPEEVAALAGEMMDRLEGRDVTVPGNAERQAAFRALADPYGIGVNCPIGAAFLAAHPELL